MLSDLIFVLKHIIGLVEKYSLVDLYTNFANTLQQISQTSTPELQEQLKNTKAQIKEALEALEPNGWSYSQQKIFNRFGAEQILGINGYKKFLAALNNNAANPIGAINEINEQRDRISQIFTNANSVLSSLGKLGEEEKLEEEQKVVQIVFDEEVSIDTIPQLADQSKGWQEIIRAYSLLADSAPEKTKIIATSKGSPFLIWLGTCTVVSKAIYYTVKPFIDIWTEVLKAQGYALALEEQKIINDQKRFELFKEIDRFEKERITEVIESVANEHHIENLSPEKINEAKVALLKAGPNLYEFITRGGKVDATKNGESTGISSNLQLAPQYAEAFKLRDNIQKLLQSSTPSKGEGEETEKKHPGRPKKEDGADVIQPEELQNDNNTPTETIPVAES